MDAAKASCHCKTEAGGFRNQTDVKEKTIAAADTHSERQTDTQTNRPTDKQTDTQTERQTDNQTD